MCEGNDPSCETTELGATRHGEVPKESTEKGYRDSLKADHEEAEKL